MQSFKRGIALRYPPLPQSGSRTETTALLCDMVSNSGSLVVKATDSWLTCHEFEPSTTKDPPCMENMHVKSVKSSNILPLVWWGS
ncbi:hypothetical protein TNCV_4439971 [Trichonephila clavipes]|nr:hypothetical protein TNCV_4439971 [Trichonephila clavipes]